MFDDLFGPTTLAELRKLLGVTQREMADAMGMPFRSYQDIEKGPNPVRPIHVNAAAFAAIKFAAAEGGPSLPYELGRIVKQAAKK